MSQWNTSEKTIGEITTVHINAVISIVPTLEQREKYVGIYYDIPYYTMIIIIIYNVVLKHNIIID